MKTSFYIRHLLLVIFFLIVFGGCSKPINEVKLKIEGAYVKQPLEKNNVTSAYMVLTNTGSIDITINGIKCLDVEEAQLHDSKNDKESGMIYMFRIKNITILPKETLYFKPGGKHVMIIGMKRKQDINCYLNTLVGENFPIKFEVK